VHIADPDGFVVEFAQEIPRQRGRLSGEGTPGQRGRLSGGDGAGAASVGDEPRR
jgi:hypothetical protein